MSISICHKRLVELLTGAGFMAAEEEAIELLTCAGGNGELLETLVARRLDGEPIAWITGFVSFCDLQIHVTPGVFVPRWQSEPLARRAVKLLPPDGVAIDVCTGAGAMAATLVAQRPRARVVGTDIDGRAVACAKSNRVEVYQGDLFATLPPSLEGCVDVIVGVVPYVPTTELPLLPRDTLEFETALAYDGGSDGTMILRRVIREGPRFLRQGGALLLELGGDQAHAINDELMTLGYGDVSTLVDDEGDLRGIEATYHGRSADNPLEPH